MKLQVYFLYRTDEHLSTDSKELLFIGNLPNCIKAARKFNATDTQINELGYQKSKSAKQCRLRVYARTAYT